MPDTADPVAFNDAAIRTARVTHQAVLFEHYDRAGAQKWEGMLRTQSSAWARGRLGRG